MAADPDSPPPDPRRTFRRMLAAIALGCVAFLVFLFTACGVLFSIAGLAGSGVDRGETLAALACAVAGGAVLYGLERIRRRL